MQHAVGEDEHEALFHRRAGRVQQRAQAGAGTRRPRPRATIHQVAGAGRRSASPSRTDGGVIAHEQRTVTGLERAAVARVPPTIGRMARIPDKPTLDGLEARWSAVWEERRHLPLRPHPHARRDLLDRHAAADGERLAAHGFGVRLRADRLASRATSACAAATSSTRWAGTTTACRPSAACRTTSACAATRTCRTTPRSCRPRSRARTRSRSRGRTSSSCASSLVAEDEQAFEELWRRLGLSVDWTLTYTTVGHVGAAHESARVPAQPRARRGVPGRRADALGRRLPHRGRAGRARRPRDAGRVPRVALPPGRRRRRPGRSTRRGPSCSRRASRSSRIPTTRATSRCSAPRSSRRCTASRVPVVAHHLADPEKGTGIAMICTFGDTTDVVWWRELQLPTRAIIGVDGRFKADPPDGLAPTAARARTRRSPGKNVEAGAEDRRRAAAARRVSSRANRARSRTR